MVHTVKVFGIVNKAEVDAFLELSCFFNDPTDFRRLLVSHQALPAAPAVPSPQPCIKHVLMVTSWQCWEEQAIMILMQRNE